MMILLIKLLNLLLMSKIKLNKMNENECRRTYELCCDCRQCKFSWAKEFRQIHMLSIDILPDNTIPHYRIMVKFIRFYTMIIGRYGRKGVYKK